MRVIVSVVLAVGMIASAVAGSWALQPTHPNSLLPRPAEAQPLLVQQVLSGDTVLLTNPRWGPEVTALGTVTARLIGVRAPHFGITSECYAVEAQGRLRQILPEGSLVWATTDATPRDENGRWLMYLWTPDGYSVNLGVATEGLVRAALTYNNNRHYSQIAQATEQAYNRNAGLWGACP